MKRSPVGGTSIFVKHPEDAMATTEQESREVAEAARETEWADKGFMREIFLGNLRIDWIHPYPGDRAPAEGARVLRAR